MDIIYDQLDKKIYSKAMKYFTDVLSSGKLDILYLVKE
jgi:hypothetical protein